MDPTAFNRLTARQQQCLRLVAAPATSKQIARELGISSHTVDQHIREALATLGLSDRMEAARRFIAHERGTAGDATGAPQVPPPFTPPLASRRSPLPAPPRHRWRRLMPPLPRHGRHLPKA
ncbi:response regulator transcription factor [Sphingomonas changnyeongensis]|uniref:response regulator transcription factor n=1 Tax=Sphingomonas changnyeongensis TaxID=2698679 RepID=UPI00191BCD0D|nr:helix-turn-helix transcriptional regulator [Sphingomonas changnyeongensis]